MTIPVSISPGQALWNQRERIAALRDRFKALSAAIGEPSDLNLYQWAEIAAFALEFRPDRVIELGRGFGNSTCCFIEVANQLGGAPACRVVSLCRNDSWFTYTTPRLERVVPPEWFTPAEIRLCDILKCEVTALLGGAQRCLVFWDAHGFEVAEWVLSKLLPQLVDKPHVVLMHDLSDTRFEIHRPEYGETGIWGLSTNWANRLLWKGTDASAPAFWLGTVFSKVAQAISIVDFTSRSRLPLHSGAESLHAEIASNPAKMALLRELLGDDFFSLDAHWFWFTLNEAPGKLFFPPYTALEAHQQELERLSQELERVSQEKREVELLREGDIEANRQELTRLSREKMELEVIWEAVQNSAGWRMLNKWRRVRERVFRPDSFQRKLYESVVATLRGR